MVDELMEADGARCELRSVKNDLIFLGRIQRTDGETVTVAEATGRAVPPVIYNTEVKLIVRGLKVMKGMPLVLYGQICGSTQNIWKLDHLESFAFSERREAFRQKVETSARILCINSIYMPMRAARQKRYDASICRLIDISLSGVLVRSREHLESGDCLLMLDARLLPGEKPYVFTCQVCRVEMYSKHEFHYGCSFLSLSPGELDRLCKSIFALQRQDIQSHR